MSTVPVLERTVEVDSDFLPASAAKLIITQYLECEDTSSWAWIIVGTFFDSRDQPLWSTEIFIAQLDIDSDSEYSDNTDESYHGGSEDLQSAMPGGWNPVTGRDPSGTRPNFAPFGAPVPGQGQPYIYHSGGPGQNFGTYPHQNPWASMTYGMYPLGNPGTPAAPPAGIPMTSAFAPQGTTGGYYAQQTFSYQPNGTGNMLPRQTQPWPAIDPTMPAAQMTNSTGGVGCEPGYNLFFAAEHTKAHIFRSNIPPWQLPATAQLPFKAVHIPCNTTLEELLKGFGCTNPVSKKNKVFEIQSAGGGKWYKGLEVNGASKDLLKKSIKEIGWDATRTGNPREKPVVCLWFCKD
ncbi:hypothetical protein C2857_004314 [Epichloe festucae Fl1]|uniref:Uncharacterized protein n=1 Tax=Epichloe festucae (strain Fl1) TaxID=877507 RepID=A0A7S9KKP7_EPIFF|nr:hypothetical protein C2857_004314 [Epichloe festucae Fl1]